MVQSLRQSLRGKLPRPSQQHPQIICTPRDSRQIIQFLKNHLSSRDRGSNASLFDWGELGVSNTRTDKAKILIVTELDLRDYSLNNKNVPWLDINLIVVETYWMLNYYRPLFDPCRQYILIADTWMAQQDFDQSFDWLPTLDRFYIKFDVYEILRMMSTCAPEYNVCQVPAKSKPFGTFALIGRRDHYRTKFVHRMVDLELKSSLIKYQGQVLYNTAKNLDRRSYNRTKFWQTQGEGDQCITGSFDIIPEFYRNYRFETSVETTQWNEGGWPFREYNISEKTLKPIITGVPAVILAPQGYHAWLLQTLGMDVSGGLFVHTADAEPDDNDRLDATLVLIDHLVNELNQDPDPKIISQNRQSLMIILDCNTRELRRCADFLSHLL